MTLVLPITSLTNINLAELQLNSPTCPVNYNNTHVTATISLDGCGTKTVVKYYAIMSSFTFLVAVAFFFYFNMKGFYSRKESQQYLKSSLT